MGGVKVLKRYITEQMHMSHIYQPVMLRTILENGGEATTAQVHLPTNARQMEIISINLCNRN